MVHRSMRLRRAAALLIGSLLVLVMAAPVLADHLLTPTGSVTMSDSGTIVRAKNAGVTVSGTVTCDQDGYAYVQGTLSQANRRGTTYGNFGTGWMSCEAGVETPWMATAMPAKGKFLSGTATLYLYPTQLEVNEYDVNGDLHMATGFTADRSGTITVN